MLTASRRRMLKATWVDKAWRHVSTCSHLMYSSFVHTGFLIALDGSEDKLIKLQGLEEEYSFRGEHLNPQRAS